MSKKSTRQLGREKLESQGREREDMLKHIKTEVYGRPFQIIPPLHYAVGDRNSEEMADQIGTTLIEIGLKLLPKSQRDKRWYGAEENICGSDGSPITTVNVFFNSSPEYLLIRPDGLNDKVHLGYQRAVTAQLRVDNPLDVPSFVMALAFSPTPKYDIVREGLFDLIERFPLVDNREYCEYVGKYSEMDKWLVSRKKS